MFFVILLIRAALGVPYALIVHMLALCRYVSVKPFLMASPMRYG